MGYGYCNVCRHRVVDFEKHRESEDHKRHLRGIIRRTDKPISAPTEVHGRKYSYGRRAKREVW